MTDVFRTLATGGTAEISVERSRFLAETFPVETEAQVEVRIEAIRQREHKATHHCSAYRLGAEGATYRYDDDGEPSGTGGPPILRQIDGRDLTNTLAVVTRYFGGTKLGTGGLARAYGAAAAAALDASTVVERVVRTPIRLRFAYDDTKAARQVIRQFDTDVQNRDYTEVTELIVGVRASECKAFLDAFTNALGGRGEVLRVGAGDAGNG